MKHAVQFGAGNIGRGFIGAVLAQAGYTVTFADVVEDLLTQINARGGYTVHVTDHKKYDIEVKGVSAVHSGSDAAVQAIVGADIVTTAVGLRILKFVAPTVAAGITARKAAGIEQPLNVMACENGLKATSQLKELVFASLDDQTKAWAETHVGFPDAAVDRIVPPVHCEVPLDVAVEEFFEWDAERSGFVGEVPVIPGMTPVDNLLAYIERKLFTLNTGHAATAYLGKLHGLRTIGESIADPQIQATVKTVMQNGENRHAAERSRSGPQVRFRSGRPRPVYRDHPEAVLESLPGGCLRPCGPRTSPQARPERPYHPADADGERFRPAV